MSTVRSDTALASSSNEASDDKQATNTVQVLALAASNPHASAEVLKALAISDNSYVRSKVAENENAPSLVLDTLMNDCTSVRTALAHNPRAIQRVWSLVTDKNPQVRLTLAENPDLPEHVYHVLEKDPNRFVAQRARRTLKDLQKSNNPVISFFRLFVKAS